MINQTRCTMNKPIMNSNTAGKNFQVKTIAIKKYKIVIL